jgi:hypothetical protein
MQLMMHTCVTRRRLLDLCGRALLISTVVELPPVVLILARPRSVYALAGSRALRFCLPFSFPFWLVASSLESTSSLEFVECSNCTRRGADGPADVDGPGGVDGPAGDV